MVKRLVGRTAPEATSAAAKGEPAEDKTARRAAKAAGKAKTGAGKAARPRFQAPPDDGKVRLNLGSGDKNLPGYVNVDVAPSRKGAAPDLLCDLRSLKLEDGYADELLSVHVIEHFYYWEVQELLAEWRRVIKPGGRIELECPNLAYAAQQIVEDEGRLADASDGWRTTMFVLYGDPAWKDPLMCHRWGWTPRTLGAELERAGFVEVREEPALFKRGNPRDMRVVAVKPNEE
ncbi:MAG: methyltransferase domain-containing protein [Tistlia sp.]|uniref:class I SAM-dependent methyltransferase n=1 Tax=Tistlia sp. TaxID=3057121 RepID=UPI0034A35152